MSYFWWYFQSLAYTTTCCYFLLFRRYLLCKEKKKKIAKLQQKRFETSYSSLGREKKENYTIMTVIKLNCDLNSCNDDLLQRSTRAKRVDEKLRVNAAETCFSIEAIFGVWQNLITSLIFRAGVKDEESFRSDSSIAKWMKKCLFAGWLRGTISGRVRLMLKN